MRIYSALLIPILLASCTVGPDYVRPQLEIPTSWRIDVSEGATTVDSTWWAAFNDPVLDQLVMEAMRDNLDLKLATIRLDQFLGILETSRSQFFPQTGYGAGVSRQDNAISPLSNVDPPAFSTYQGFTNISWELDLWGRIRRSNEAARSQLLSNEEGRRAVLLSLVANVSTGYVTLRGYDHQLNIARATQKSYAETLRIFQLRHQHGAVSGVELSQVKSQYENAAQTIPRLEALVAQQEHLLSVLLGKNPGSIPRGKSIEKLIPPGLPNDLPLTLLERRPDIRQAEYETIAANARIGEAKALYFPTISLSGLLGRQSSELADLFQHGGGFWSMGGNLAGPLFSFGAVAGQVRQAESLAAQAVTRYEQTVKNAFRDVEDALVAFIKIREQLDSLERQVQALNTYARLSGLKYESGSMGYLQVLDADRTLFSAQLAQSQTRANLLNSYINIYRSLGGGWVDLVDPQVQCPKAPRDAVAETTGP